MNKLDPIISNFYFSMKPMTYVIESKGGMYKLAGDNNTEYPSIAKLINNNKTTLNFMECIFPSDVGELFSIFN